MIGSLVLEIQPAAAGAGEVVVMQRLGLRGGEEEFQSWAETVRIGTLACLERAEAAYVKTIDQDTATQRAVDDMRTA